MTGPVAVVRAALRLLVRSPGPAFLAAGAAALVNAVPDVLRHLPVWSSPSLAAALAVDLVGFLTGLAAQLWVTGAVAALPDGGGLRPRGALGRGAGLAWRAVRTAPSAVAAGVVVGGGISALITVPVSVAALGAEHVLGPLDTPAAGAFAVATVSDVVATWGTLPILALVLVLAARAAGARAGGSSDPGTGQ
ncbi:hypothetical protein OF117_00270 [Geodermatophilus sp. YIM 151500]|uniref:hypothetical protein n=1 Tax=Geodermatophilus sp. YIM 151500 TaxID=2984531 RepID=UPI0021E4DF9F|nr:hypothetical protein [Geodermatophilus sp. YIM 151500]MCV2487781.1 hypothetical protein [Geodermatophilus sp. YIM 151500]